MLVPANAVFVLLLTVTELKGYGNVVVIYPHKQVVIQVAEP
jgi:hypothetical protein